MRNKILQMIVLSGLCVSSAQGMLYNKSSDKCSSYPSIGLSKHNVDANCCQSCCNFGYLNISNFSGIYICNENINTAMIENNISVGKFCRLVNAPKNMTYAEGVLANAILPYITSNTIMPGGNSLIHELCAVGCAAQVCDLANRDLFSISAEDYELLIQRSNPSTFNQYRQIIKFHIDSEKKEFITMPPKEYNNRPLLASLLLYDMSRGCVSSNTLALLYSCIYKDIRPDSTFSTHINEEKRTFFGWACFGGHLELVEAILRNNPRFSPEEKDLKILIDRSDDKLSDNDEQYSPLPTLSSIHDNERIVHRTDWKIQYARLRHSILYNNLRNALPKQLNIHDLRALRAWAENQFL